MTSWPTFRAALHGAADRMFADQIAALTDLHASGQIDASTFAALVSLATKTHPDTVEQFRCQVIAARRAAGHGVPHDWGLADGEPDNALTEVQVSYLDRREALAASHHVMGIA